MRAQQWESLERFRTLLCQVLLALNEYTHYSETSKRHYMRYCHQVNIEKVLYEDDLFKAYAPDAQDSDTVSEERLKDAMNKMSTLQISMGSEIKPVGEIKIEVLKRIVQVHGKLEEYNPLEDKNIPRVADVFLCLDQIGPFKYMLNVVDQK